MTPTKSSLIKTEGNSEFKIELRNVHKSFGPTKQILRGTNLQIQRGETMVILGGSGTGKSVLLKCLLGLEPIQQGEIFIDGHNITHIKGEARMELMSKFGMLFQGAALFDSMTVWENIAFVLLRRGVKRATAKEVAIEKLRLVGLKPEVADQNPSSLSGGQRKRVGLARAVCHQPEIILYDEPTTGLDPITSDIINELILKLQSELKCTSLMITHDMTSAFKVANRMAFLYQGEFIALGTPQQFRKGDIRESTLANAEVRPQTGEMVTQFIEGRSTGPITA
ncbi:MAG: ABC transporter ATP-binding protein [Pseudomonas fluorescens]|nr:MAG: ABC transporter ATP-binding protein [Pseudomonas fluorescens]